MINRQLVVEDQSILRFVPKTRSHLVPTLATSHEIILPLSCPSTLDSVCSEKSVSNDTFSFLASWPAIDLLPANLLLIGNVAERCRRCSCDRTRPHDVLSKQIPGPLIFALSTLFAFSLPSHLLCPLKQIHSWV